MYSDWNSDLKRNKNRLDSSPNFEPGVENRGIGWKDGRLILQEYICDIRYVESNSTKGGGTIYWSTWKEAVDFASTVERKKKEKKKWKNPGKDTTNEIR